MLQPITVNANGEVVQLADATFTNDTQVQILAEQPEGEPLQVRYIYNYESNSQFCQHLM